MSIRTLIDWHRMQSANYLELARFCRREEHMLTKLLPSGAPPLWQAESYYAAAVAHARHARSLVRTGRTDPRGCARLRFKLTKPEEPVWRSD